ncbi:MAG: hypothetical protein SGJ20_03275 [Planctomycetota bacterium]|nr:hypothetical protein [Planctomycetota bacterium]
MADELKPDTVHTHVPNTERSNEEQREFDVALAAGHEISDVSTGGIFYFLIGMVAVILATVLFLGWLFDHYSAEATLNDPPVSPLAKLRPENPPKPNLQVSDVADMVTFRKQQEADLQTLGWVDETEKLARIPIKTAMSLVLEKGLPKWPPLKTDAAKTEAAKADAAPADAPPADVTSPVAVPPVDSGAKSAPAEPAASPAKSEGTQ